MEEKIGEITHYFGHIPAGIIKLTGELKQGDQIHVKGATTDFSQTVKSMQIDHKDVQSAKKGEEVGVEIDQKVRDGDEVFLIK
uniref:Translation elongation factor-like protein n=1 Tax=candidate division WWE3 bacterium TaxID=2053526 RepID=A0A831Z0H8_UNCKA